MDDDASDADGDEGGDDARGDDDDAFDVLVVGSGPAGLAAAIAAGRRDLDAAVFERDAVGGELVNRPALDDLPGHVDITGPDLRADLVDELRTVGGQIRLASVDEIRLEQIQGEHDRPVEVYQGTSENLQQGASVGAPFTVAATDGTYPARSVIVATGGRPVELDVPGADEYRGHGIFYCATCDGPLYAGEVVAVSGSDDWAVADALALTDHAERVLVVEDGPRLAAGASLRERIADRPDVEIRTHTEIRSVEGDDVLQRLELFDREEGIEYVEEVGGLYVQHGVTPRVPSLPDGVELTDCGAVVVDEALETGTPGLFAAGDVRQSSPRTVASAIGDGVTACNSAARSLEFRR